MKKYKDFMRNKKNVMIVIVIFAGCMLLFGGLNRPNAMQELSALKKQRDDLNRRITELESKLNRDKGPALEEKRVLVSVEQTETILFEHFMDVQGVVESDTNVLLASKIDGMVAKINVKEGDKVKKGQVLAQLDDRMVRGNIEEIKTNLELAEAIFLRRDRLWKQKIGSEVDYLTAKNNVESLKKRLATLNEQLADARIISPLDGIVDEVILNEGEYASKKKGVFRVLRPSSMKIKVSVSERYAARLKKNDPVKVKLPELGLSFDSRIRSVAGVIDSKNRTLSFEVIVPRDIENLRPNMLAVVTVNDYSAETVTVPLRIVQKTADSSYLFVISPDKLTNKGPKVERRTVETGLYSGNRLEIRSGLKPGEQVIVEAYQDLSDGQVVKIISNRK